MDCALRSIHLGATPVGVADFPSENDRRPSPSDDPWTAARFEQALQPFFEEHAELRTDPTARAPQHTRVTKTGRGTWDIVQVLCDAEGDDDWMLTATVDLEASAKAGRPVLVMRGINR